MTALALLALAIVALMAVAFVVATAPTAPRRRYPGPWYRTAVERQIERGLCPRVMRTPGAISCYWSCDLGPGHDGLHECRIGEHVYRFSDADAEALNSRGPHED